MTLFVKLSDAETISTLYVFSWNTTRSPSLRHTDHKRFICR